MKLLSIRSMAYMLLLLFAATKAWSLPNCSEQEIRDLATPELMIISANREDSASSPYCRVEAEMATENNKIRVRIALPEQWNSKFLFEATGGGAGLLVDLGAAVERGYAAATTDTGHVSYPGDLSFWLNKEQRADWIYRGVHTATLGAKSLVAAFYDKPIDYAYIRGCSNGGRAGLMEAQRYPDEYDGVLAAAPAADPGLMALNWMWAAQVLQRNPISSGQWKLIGERVLESCDGLDGLVDGLIQDDRRCTLPVAELSCAQTDEKHCLDETDLEAIRKIWYKPTLADGTEMLPESRGYEHQFPSIAFYAGASRLELLSMVLGPKPNVANELEMRAPEPTPPLNHLLPFLLKGMPSAVDHSAQSFAQGILMPDRTVDVSSFDIVEDGAELAREINQVIDLTHDPDLKPFLERGSKLLLWHGLADKTLSPSGSYQYFERARDNALAGGIDAESFDQAVKLYTSPAIHHCTGGSGAHEGDLLGALDRWVRGVAEPHELKVFWRDEVGRISRSRILCPMPYEPQYDGNGSVDSAESFNCEIPADRVGITGIKTPK